MPFNIASLNHSRSGNIFALLFGSVALVGVVGVASMNLLVGPVTTASQVTRQNMAENDLLMNAKVVVMHASTLPMMGDEDGDGYVEPVPFVPTSDPSCNITLPGQGGCLPTDIGAIQTDPWGTQYAYCVWDHGDPASSSNRIDGEDSTSGAVLAIISAGPNKQFETPCLPYDGDPDTPDYAINPNGVGDDLVQIYTYAAAVAGSGGLWELKLNEPETAVIDKKLEVGDVAGGTGFAFDTATGTGEFPYVKTDFLASKSGGTTPVTMDSNIALDGRWLSGDGDNEGVLVSSSGSVFLGRTDMTGGTTMGGAAMVAHTGGRIRLISSGDETAGTNYIQSGDPAGTTGSWRRLVIGNYLHALGASTPKMIIDETGNVGIGTRYPSESLTVDREGNNAKLLLRTYGDSSNTSGVYLWTARGTSDAPSPLQSGQTIGNIIWYDNERVASAAKIDARSKGNWSNGVAPAALQFFTRDVGDTASRLRMVIDEVGKVGIGTTNPASRFQVGEGSIIVGGGTAARPAATIIADTINDQGTALRLKPGPNTGAASLVAHNSDNSVALAVIEGGKVGIGTSSPATILDVRGDIASSVDGEIARFTRTPQATDGQYLSITQGVSGNIIRGYSGANNAKHIILDATTDAVYSPPTAGSLGIAFRIQGTNKFLIRDSDIHAYNNRITAIATPTASTDAANKAYVDTLGNRTCANGQILKFQSGSWACAGDNSGGGADNLGGGGTTTGTLYSKATTGYGYVGQDGNNVLRFDAGAGNDRALLRIAGTWVLHVEPTFLRPYAHNAIDLGNSGVRWRDGWFSGGVTSGSLSPAGPIYNDHSNATYDVWLQGSNALASGEARNLALLGHTTQDRLYVNYNSEYTGGTTIGGPVSVTGILSGNGSGLTNLNASNLATGTVPMARIGSGTKNTSTFLRGDGTFAAPPSGADNLGNHTATANLNMSNRAITADVGVIRDASGGWVRTYGATGWYNQTYGGGWHMQDTTWIRAYSNKSVVTGGNMQAAAFLYGSDERLKADIRPLGLSLDDLDGINAYRYHYKADEDETPRIGVIAQEVQAVFPEAVETGEDGMMSVDYPALVPVLLDAVKQLKAENDAIRRQMKADNDNLRMEIRALTKGAR